VSIAHDGNMAIEKVWENNFDIVLLDMKLPPLNGLETYLAIRKIRWNVVVIVITRDVIILVGFLVMLLTSYHPKINPSFLSKLTTTFQICTILLVLLGEYYFILKELRIIAIYGTAILTILSGSHYIYVGTRILNEKK
jgi:cardiolipin synthase